MTDTSGRESARPRLDLAVITPSLDKYGGAERYVVECVRRWQDHHDITLYAQEFNESMLAEHGISDAVVRKALAKSFDGQHATLLNAALLPSIWNRQVGRHDIYNTHVWPTHLIDRHPMVWIAHEPFRTLHDLRFEQNWAEPADGTALVYHVYPKFDYDRVDADHFQAMLKAIDLIDKSVIPDRIIANSRRSANELVRIYDCAVDDIVYPGVEPSDFIDLPIDPNLFVTISQLWPHKRVRLLIEAVALAPEAQLIVIGDGPERDALEQMAEGLGVADRVFVFSGLTNRELTLILARACAFLFAAIREPFGIVILEAMAAGKPVIAVEGGGYAEVCTTESAFLVAPTPGAFAEKMSILQRDPQRARDMGAAGRRLSASYTWRRSADTVEASIIDCWRRQTASTPATDASTQDAPLVGAQYYVWYGEGYGAAHWDDNPEFGHIRDQADLGYYGSGKGETIERHLDMFTKMGLDFLLLNLHVDDTGPNPSELGAIGRVFDVIAHLESPMKCALQIAPYVETAGPVAALIELIDRRYGDHPGYLRLAGKPALFWFWSSAHDRHAAFFDDIQKPSSVFTNLAVSLRLPHGVDEKSHTFDLFEGWAPYSPLELASPHNWASVWRRGWDAADAAGMDIRMATISPGYDDTGLRDGRRSDNAHRSVPRDNGETYMRTMRFVEALDPVPDIVLVSTFNEMHENTHIEPSRNNGNLYLQMTRDFVTRLKNRCDDGDRP